MPPEKEQNTNNLGTRRTAVAARILQVQAALLMMRYLYEVEVR